MGAMASMPIGTSQHPGSHLEDTANGKTPKKRKSPGIGGTAGNKVSKPTGGNLGGSPSIFNPTNQITRGTFLGA